MSLRQISPLSKFPLPLEVAVASSRPGWLSPNLWGSQAGRCCPARQPCPGTAKLVRWRHLLVIPPPQPALKSLTSHSGPRGTAFFSPSVPAKLLGRDWPPLNCHILCIKSVPKLLECLIPTSRPSEEEELLGEKHTQGVKSPVFWLLSFSSPSLQSQNLKTQTTLRA
jgi:hypothetical protein